MLPTLFFTAPVPAPVMFPMKTVKSSAAMIFAELCADAKKRAEPSGCFRPKQFCNLSRDGCFRSKHFCNRATEGCFRSKHLGYLSLRIVINPKCFFLYLSVMCPQKWCVCTTHCVGRWEACVYVLPPQMPCKVKLKCQNTEGIQIFTEISYGDQKRDIQHLE